MPSVNAYHRIPFNFFPLYVLAHTPNLSSHGADVSMPILKNLNDHWFRVIKPIYKLKGQDAHPSEVTVAYILTQF